MFKDWSYRPNVSPCFMCMDLISNTDLLTSSLIWWCFKFPSDAQSRLCCNLLSAIVTVQPQIIKRYHFANRFWLHCKQVFEMLFLLLINRFLIVKTIWLWCKKSFNIWHQRCKNRKRAFWVTNNKQTKLMPSSLFVKRRIFGTPSFLASVDWIKVLHHFEDVNIFPVWCSKLHVLLKNKTKQNYLPFMYLTEQHSFFSKTVSNKYTVSLSVLEIWHHVHNK